ncbi:MAG TPA: acetylxylan esterase [Pirellulales bacterium]
MQPLKNLNGYFPFQPPATKEEWEKRAAHVRRQILVSMGLWPMPAKTPDNAVIHDPVDRPEYTVERVYLESYPGHFVTGSLYRPKGVTGRRPGILCPYGHWDNGRFTDAGRASVRKQIVEGGERFEAGGRSPLQSMCAQLARMGCVVFQYDMVGYADSIQIPFAIAHGYKARRPQLEGTESWGFFSPQADLNLQTIMGLQTYNSIRVLDWFSGLPDVDPERIGMTGGSGGGTQTFILCAIDPRPAASFPAVMVSTAMQGGCTCENASLLRNDTGNVEFAALFAPKPLGMTGADDWTVQIATKGLPELKKLYTLLGAPDLVMAKPLNQFGHNYNYVSRAVMYSFFNKHLKIGLEEPIVEEEYKPLTIPEMTVWSDSHPRPLSGDDHERKLTRYMADEAKSQLAALAPRDAASLAEYRRVVGGAFEVIIGHGLPAAKDVEFEMRDELDRATYMEFSGLLKNKQHGSELPVVFFFPHDWKKTVVLWLDAAGKAGLYASDGAPKPEIRKLIDAGCAVGGIDLLYQGEFNPEGKPPEKARRVIGDREFAGYTQGYNHSLFASRVQDILTLAAFAKEHDYGPERIDLVALDSTGPLAAAALSLTGNAIDRAAIDTVGFRFAKVAAIDDPNFLPGAVKYGDIPGFLLLAAPHKLLLAGEGNEAPVIIATSYKASGQPDGVKLYTGAKEGEAAAAVEWLLK